MATNFDFLKANSEFDLFADVAISAEKILHIDLDACVINCRRAMEFAVKWMYSIDKDLELPMEDSLVNLINDAAFKNIVDTDIWRRMEFIRKIGNKAAHGGKAVTQEQAELCLENLFVFLDCVAYFYAPEYTEREFDKTLLELTSDEAAAFVTKKDEKTVEEAPKDDKPEIDIEQLIRENEALKAELSARRAEQQQTYVPKPLDLSEYETRRIYVDFMIEDAGWTLGVDCVTEFELYGMPNRSEIGYADYVFFGSDGKPLALLEAKRTCNDVSKGRHQAKLYADALENKYGRRPVIFLSNGFDTRIWNDRFYPERKVAAIYSKRDLEKLYSLQKMKMSLKNITVNRDIAGRYYQEGAIKAVCEAFDKKNRRKALLVMATGSGKTRTVIGLCDVLLRHGWVKNILFLADRNSLVTQAKRSFVNMLPSLSVTNLCEDKSNYDARCVFSTYQTMMNCIDNVRDEDNRKLYTCGHFDLIIVDEAHRSIYDKYRDIFTYFDAPLIGLTATPKAEIDKNTYEIFELENGVPTYGYELAQAVTDGFLVDFTTIETKLKFIEKGIVYDQLSDEDKEEYENTFADEEGNHPHRIAPSALNAWIFNEDTIREVLHILMRDGLRVDYGEKLGKTIIFARNHNHAEKILEVFGKEYPHLVGYAMVIDNKMTYSQSAIDEFSERDKFPQIAISVDMLDTGIDIPEILNLVFFKKVKSKSKFWQMIGRGTRKCDGLIDGKDKDGFYIFDFCGNFEFFRMNQTRAVTSHIPLQGAIFLLKAKLAYTLQDIKYQSDEYEKFRSRMVKELLGKMGELNKENFAVRQHLRYVEKYSDPQSYDVLTFEDTVNMEQEIASLITPDKDEASAIRFDALIYGMLLAHLEEKDYYKARNGLMVIVNAISTVANIPEVKAHSALIKKILQTDYLVNLNFSDFEYIRTCLRGLIKYIPTGRNHIYTTNFDEEVLSTEWKKSDLDNDDLKNYRAKAEFYIRKHQDEAVIQKLKGNIPLNAEDISSLERILWSEAGTREDYAAECGEKPLGEFVREIVGLDMAAAKEAFAKYLDDVNLNSSQIYFINKIIEYIVKNGMMKDMSVLKEPPFTDRGSVSEIFTDVTVWLGIKAIIQQINANAA